ncbi:hypothetical protein MMC15_006486 [Xylographa vitiligo]|nr:hypothetical protein [Xylographa vitiligo]
MAQQQITAKKQQELQLQYTTYKNNLQQLAQKIGDVEQETEEHKYDKPILLNPSEAVEICSTPPDPKAYRSSASQISSRNPGSATSRPKMFPHGEWRTS